FADVAFDECAGKIFRRCISRSDPALANLNVAWRGELSPGGRLYRAGGQRARRRRSSLRAGGSTPEAALQCGLELDHEGIRGDVIADATAGIVSRAQKHARLLASADGSLSIEVKFTQRFNFIAEEF